MAGTWPIGSKVGKREKVEAMSFVWMMMLFADTETLGEVGVSLFCALKNACEKFKWQGGILLY